MHKLLKQFINGVIFLVIYLVCCVVIFVTAVITHYTNTLYTYVNQTNVWEAIADYFFIVPLFGVLAFLWLAFGISTLMTLFVCCLCKNKERNNR